ncbi:MAG: Type II secretion system protein E [Chlamydiae bacterium]|nr:Type II secretion system protein E [Chlamydiota bacterium]
MDAKDLFEEGKRWLKKMTNKPEKKEEEPVPPSSGLSLGDELVRQGVLGGDDVNENLAKQFGMTVLKEAPEINLTRDFYQKVPYAFVKRHNVLPFDKEGEEILVAVADPLNLDPLEELRLLLGADVKAHYCPRDFIMTAINDCYNKEHGAASQLLADLDEQSKEIEMDSSDVEVYDLLDDARAHSPIVKLLNLILSEAIQQGASDIHFEPLEDGLRVRYRIDGVLHARHTPASEYQSQLLTRIKVMAKMDIAERRLPQDGRIKLRMGRREIDFRVSTIPIVDGERIVMRILIKGNITLGLEQLGMLSETLEEFKRLIHLPEGILLVTGPTGSGKTTTLYSGVNDLYSDEINIMTIEDPVEYNLKGIAQIGVRPKINLTFAAGLRHILRQDPDVVMVGEIRDLETAEIAIQASLTGHLVLSTLHTNDAPSAITRLVDMGIEPYLLSSSVVGVLAQRLVRTICLSCKEAYSPTDDELKGLGLKRSMIPKGKLYRGTGCQNCYQSGYQGRHGVYELLTINSAIQQQIVKSPDAVQMRKAGLEHGMLPLRNHGAQLVLQGITTESEVLRVIRGVDEE